MMNILYVVVASAMVGAAHDLPQCDDASSVVPAAYSFDAAGPSSGGLSLSLSLPHSAIAGTTIIAAMKLQSVSPRPVQLSVDDRPWGYEYNFEVKNGDTGEAIKPRDDYTPIITRISQESLGGSCSAYQVATLTQRFSLPVGRYIVRAFRIPREVTEESGARAVRKLPIVYSNDITLTITP